MSEGTEAEALTTDAISARSIIQEYIVPVVTYVDRHAHCGQGKAEIVGADAASAAQDGSD